MISLNRTYWNSGSGQILFAWTIFNPNGPTSSPPRTLLIICLIIFKSGPSYRNITICTENSAAAEIGFVSYKRRITNSHAF